MSMDLPAPERVRRALSERGLEIEIQQFPQGTRTAQDAADAIGVQVGQIVKSLVFSADGEPLLVLVSGSNMADTKKLAQLTGKKIERADANRVREATGFAIGGVPPVGHSTPMTPFIDEDLLQYDVVYAAAGTPFDVFAIEPDVLVRVSGGQVADVARR